MEKLIYPLLLLFAITTTAQFHNTSSLNGIESKQTVFNVNSSPTDTILNSDYLNFVTLIVDYDTYEFEGGNLSYYQHCNNCTEDSIPFEILVNYPGDFGNITYRIQNTLDTMFFASIIWMGTGQIYHPENYSFDFPFNTINNKVEKPDNIEYYDKYGSKVYTDSTFIQSADAAWYKIDSLEITKLFSENNCKVGIYLYPPSVGVFNPATAKWIIFFYLNDYNSAVHPASSSKNENQLLIYPNPCKDYLTIENIPIKTNSCLLEIIDLSGRP
ncbi:MAG: hypothetical protein K8R74_04180, partial [Bacteroidales bacterium]|nr:hypothetical protein [Bacteroidales bacterium]